MSREVNNTTGCKWLDELEISNAWSGYSVILFRGEEVTVGELCTSYCPFPECILHIGSGKNGQLRLRDKPSWYREWERSHKEEKPVILVKGERLDASD